MALIKRDKKLKYVNYIADWRKYSKLDLSL